VSPPCRNERSEFKTEGFESVAERSSRRAVKFLSRAQIKKRARQMAGSVLLLNRKIQLFEVGPFGVIG